MVSRIPNDIFQFSTISALMNGFATSGPTPSQLPSYGTHGIGTFSKMNGELLFLDNEAWQFTSDGQTRRAPADIALPFIQVTRFVPEFSITVSGGLSAANLLETLAERGGRGAGGKNSFVPFVVRGAFKTLRIRAAGPQLYEKQGLTEVARNAKKWTLEGQKGTIFGIISPEWAQGISVAGMHAHFLSERDGNGEVRGGHVQDFEIGGEVEVEWAVTGRYHLGMPRGDEWESLDLANVDEKGIGEAEGHEAHQC